MEECYIQCNTPARERESRRPQITLGATWEFSFITYNHSRKGFDQSTELNF